MITQRDVDVLRAVARYYVLSRARIQALFFPNDRTGRSTRRRLQALVSRGFLNRSRAPVFNSAGGSAWPAYYPSKAGNAFLAEYLGDELYLTTPTRAPEPYHLLHWLAVTDTHITLDQAIDAQDTVELEGWLSEWDVCNPDEPLPERRYRLYTLLRERPRLVCVPDAAFLLGVGEYRKVFYVEQDRGTIGVRQIAARKTRGYAELNRQNKHTRHFPEATVPSFSVLMISPTVRRRDALRKALRNKLGQELWKFAAQGDLTPETFLFGPVFFPCEGDGVPLVNTSSLPASATSGATSENRQEVQQVPTTT